MKILYDHQIFTMLIYGGIPRYFFELILNFSKDKTMSVKLPVVFTHNDYLLNSNFLKGPRFFHNKRFIGKTTLIKLTSEYYTKWSLLRKNYDVFHPTYYDPYFKKYIGNKPVVVTVYDMIHELFPEHFPSDDITKNWKKETIESAARIIAISENTKKDLIRFYGIDEERITVIHLASSLKLANTTPGPFSLPSKYLLFVGQRKDYKNFLGFVEAVSSLIRYHPDLRIVCAGGGRFTAEEEKLFDKLHIRDKIVQLSVRDDLLATLYKNALAFVFPSLYEGFGIPVLEAFSCVCPTVLSNTSSLPEVGGDAALYFDPADALSICSAVEEVIRNRALREELKRKGFERAKEFSWEKTALQTKEVYRNAVSTAG